MHPADLKYSPHQFWLKNENANLFKIGLSYHYQKQLGNISYLELPAIGEIVKEGEPFGAIESSKSANDLISPITGKVIEVNQMIENKPGLINKDPYGEAWMLEIDTTGYTVPNLMSANEYLKSIA